MPRVKTMLFRLSLPLLSILFSLHALAQDTSQWELPEGAKMRLGKGRVSQIAYSPDGSRLAVASTIGIWFYDTATNREVALVTRHTSIFTCIAFSPDGETLAGGTWDGMIYLWDADSGAHVRTLELPSDHGVSSVDGVVYSPDGGTLASASSLGKIRLWDLATGVQVRTLEAVPTFVNSVAYSPDGRTLASASGNGIRVWNANTGVQVHELEGHRWDVNSVAYSPDGATLASADSEGTVLLWDMTTGEDVRTLKGHTSWVTSVSSVQSGYGGWIRLWDAVIGALASDQ